MSLEKSTGEQEIAGEMLEILKMAVFGDGGVTAPELANKLKISRPKAEYYLDELEARKLISTGGMVSFDAPTTYFPTKEGRKYLFDRDML